MSSNGALIYVPADAAPGTLRNVRRLVWVDREGREAPLKTPPRAYVYPRLSPDGKRVALDIRDQENDIWIWDLARETLTRLTLGPAIETFAIWTPNARDVIFSAGGIVGNLGRWGLFRRAADGTGTVEQLIEERGIPYAVTPDGLIFSQQQSRTGESEGAGDLMLLPLVGDGRPQPLLQTPYDELNAEPSPKGRWLAYQSNESGQFEIYVRPLPNVTAGGKWQVSSSGGTRPLWARNGRELFYESMGALMRVPLTTGSTFTAGTPSKLFDAPYFFGVQGGRGRTYDVSPDGLRFLMLKEGTVADEPAPSPRLVLVQHWFEELKRRVPTS
jgi:Tol biopolymer transport system component